MNRVRGFALLIRNNWKKSVFISGVAAFGVSLVTERVRINNLMRVYCEEAVRFGEQPLGPLSLPRHVTVILNPEACKRKAKVKFEKFVAPILHCAGLKVSVVTTETKGQSQELMNIMTDTDAVVIAGGDGTVSESVTGLLNRRDGVRFPLGIIPLGTINSTSKCIHQSDPLTGSKKVREVKAIAAATLSVVRESVKQIDVLKVETKEPEKTLYSLNSLNFGLIRDVLSQADKYWYFGNKVKPYLAMSCNVIWRRFQDLAIDRSIQIDYTKPCSGCSRCRPPVVPLVDEAKPIEIKRWWSAFVPRPKPVAAEEKTTEQEIDYSLIHNKDCGVWRHLTGEPADCHLINLIAKSDPMSQCADLFLHKLGSESLSKGSLILDAADVRNGLTPMAASLTIKFRDLRISLSTKSDDGVSPPSPPLTESVKQDSSVSEPEESSSAESDPNLHNETSSSDSSIESSKEAPRPKFSTVCIDNEEHPVSDMSITRLRNAVTVYSLPYPLFRL